MLILAQMGQSGDPRGAMRRRIVALLQEHPEGLTPAEIARLLGVDRSLTDTCLGMLRYGLVQRVERGRYRVPEAHRRERRSHHEDMSLDHGVGHPLLLLYDVKAPKGQNNNEFKVLYYYPSDVSISTF